MSLFLENRVEFIDLFIACTKLGVIFQPINILYREREVSHIVQDFADGARGGTMIEVLHQALLKNGLLMAFVVVGALTRVSYWIFDRFTRGRLHGSAIAVFGGLVLAYIGGAIHGGRNGIADLPLFAGISVVITLFAGAWQYHSRPAWWWPRVRLSRCR